MRVPNILLIFAIAALLLATAWTYSRAHEGEDHDESRPISVVVSAAPRAEAASERFELVAILKLSHYINLAVHERLPFGPELVIRGSQERLTPVLMTALSAGFALLPLLIDAATPGKEILHPVAVTIFGGLISATLLDSLLTPVLFLRFGKKSLERLVISSRPGQSETSTAPAVPIPAETF
jgi:hypothetical protein